MEHKYNDAIERAFQGDETIIGDWTRVSRGKIINIQNELDRLNDKPSQRFEPKGLPTSNNFARRKYLESEKQIIYRDLNEKIEKSYPHKDAMQKQEISDKVNALLDPNHPELKKKSLDASQDYIQSKLSSKAEKNQEKLYSASDRFQQKLSSYSETLNSDVSKEKGTIEKEDINHSSSARYEDSLSGSITDKLDNDLDKDHDLDKE